MENQISEVRFLSTVLRETVVLVTNCVAALEESHLLREERRAGCAGSMRTMAAAIEAIQGVDLLPPDLATRLHSMALALDNGSAGSSRPSS